MEEGLKEYGLDKIHTGDVLTGKVLSSSAKGITVNIGYRSDGVVAPEELPNENPQDYREGDEVEVMVVKLDDGEGNVVLSVTRAFERVVWDEFAELHASGTAFPLLLKEVVKGGLVGKYKGARVFVPASQASAHYVEKLDELVGQTVSVRLTDFDRDKQKVVASRRVVEREELDAIKTQAIASLKPGQVLTGRVARLEKFGAFIDLGGYDGLAHISQLSWRRVSKPEEVVSVGDSVDVEVLSVDSEKQKISLKLTNIKDNPWETIDAKYVVGQVYPGRVVRILNFGAFVELEEGVEGLVHISELSDERVKFPSDVVAVGDTVEVSVLSVDKKERRISLSMKQAKEEEREQANEAASEYVEEKKATTMADLFGDKFKKFLK
ncbi:MAG: 30S ribosomal protein S1 [Bacillota bacterium]|nr:30S ribosomal protein S1 [Bacillota bacterium]